jgi:hypothetical protein
MLDLLLLYEFLNDGRVVLCYVGYALAALSDESL